MSEKNADVDGFSVPSKIHVSAGCRHCLEKRNSMFHLMVSLRKAQWQTTGQQSTLWYGSTSPLYPTCWAPPPAATGCTCSGRGCRSWRNTRGPGSSWSASSTRLTLPRWPSSPSPWSSASAPLAGSRCGPSPLAPGGSERVTGGATTAGAWQSVCYLALRLLPVGGPLRAPQVTVWREVRGWGELWRSHHLLIGPVIDQIKVNAANTPSPAVHCPWETKKKSSSVMKSLIFDWAEL